MLDCISICKQSVCMYQLRYRTGNIIISSNDEPDEPDEPGHLPKKGTAFRQFQIRGSEHLPKGEPEHLPKREPEHLPKGDISKHMPNTVMSH